ncbi:hypothetical protein DIPPA_08125 [Diplonema papillatum]|nr:hypothetical protein DIPPA_08125 [Diplonema papillatum]
MCDLLDVKFRSSNYKADRIAQKQNEVTSDGKTAQQKRSASMWKRMNPAYIEEDITTTNRSQQQYDNDDFTQDKVL